MTTNRQYAWYHYRATAEAIRDSRANFTYLGDTVERRYAELALDTVTHKLAEVFATDNPQFDRSRFERAADTPSIEESQS